MLEFTEPAGDEPTGFRVYTRSKSAYERYMEEEGIPIFRGIGVYDVRQLPMGKWDRLGGRGTFLHLNGCEYLKGMFVVEVPAGGALNPEKHLYDEFFLVIEGRGSTEVWVDGSNKKQVFEWQPGTLFMAPLNAMHRLVNATNSPAILLAANNAPPVINIFQSRSVVFENPLQTSPRYTGEEDFFKAKADLEREPVRGRAAIRSNVFPDIINAELPLDNQRAPGYRRIQPYFTGFMGDSATGGFISQYPAGRYSKAHYHESGAVLVCLRGKGYTFNWPVELGPHPWEDGRGDEVKMLEYGPAGLVAAAPGGGRWFHQHFNTSKESFRVINYWGGPAGNWGLTGEDTDEVKAGNLFGIHEGGRTILYHEEDPFVRRFYAEQLAKEGVAMSMPESFFQVPVTV